jgi:hypothetical protein
MGEFSVFERRMTPVQLHIKNKKALGFAPIIALVVVSQSLVSSLTLSVFKSSSRLAHDEIRHSVLIDGVVADVMALVNRFKMILGVIVRQCVIIFARSCRSPGLRPINL